MKYKLLRIALVATFGLFCGFLNAQTSFADFRVKAVDGDGKSLSGVKVAMLLNGIEQSADTTDRDGNVVFQTLNPGTYDVAFSKEGYSPMTEKALTLISGLNKEYEAVMLKGAKEVVITTKKKSPINMIGIGQPIDGGKTLDAGRRGTGALIATNAGIVESRQGISVRGTRADASKTFIDGVPIIGGGSLPSLGTDQLAVSIGGIRAMYGDLTGGAFTLTSKSATEKVVALFEGITSTGLDPYGTNTFEAFVSGPLWKKRVMVDGKSKDMVKLGYTLNGNIGYYVDPSPTRTGVYVLKDDKMQQIKDNPLINTPNGFIHAASYLRESDFNVVAARPNSSLYNGNFIGKLEYKPSNLTSLTAYASYFYSGGRSVSNSIMNYENNPFNESQTIRSYLQFTQNFKVNKESTVKSAFYTIRAEYQNAQSKTTDAVHGNNLFDYGYIGQFTAKPTEFFAYSNYDGQQNPNKEPKIVRDQYGNTVQLRNYWEQIGFVDTALLFDGSVSRNPDRTRYTQNIYDYYASRKLTINNPLTILMSQGLLNGYNPNNVYSLHGTPGGIAAGFSKSESEKYAVFAMGQMQIKPKTVGGIERAPHDLQAGLYYEQSFVRGYSLNANGLWILMRQLMNKHIAELDVNNPILSYDENGVFTDTVRYNRLINYGEQSIFDLRFRDKLIREGRSDVYGKAIDQRTFVDINSFKPEDFELKMFSADELLNNGNGYVSYFGYDHLGNRVTGKPSISEFLNNREKRTIGAFQPVYLAAWLEDQFQFKDLIFRMGLRMERYDANQSVLKDAYSLYPIRTVGEVKEMNGLTINHPSNIGSDFAVYVNDMQSPTKVIGYRNGDRWYNADGSEQKNAEFLANQTSNGKIAPYLVDNNKQELSENSLTDYTPIMNLLPRIWFSFPLDKRKTFYVSYDMLAQRPDQGASFLTIDELYYLKFRQGSTISNGSLSSRLKTDYEVGFKQVFGRKGDKGIELSASYSEIRNDFGQYQINNGYPVTYVTIRNIDFSTITGFRGTFNMMDIGPLNLSASYMLQFADGTGSNISSQAALIASNQPNLRNVIPLGDLDIRHNLKVSATWAWGGGRDIASKKNLYNGPILFGKEIFKNTSFNIIGNTYSGGPYTPTTRSVQIGAVDRAQIKGVPFGARLPWQYNFDMNVSKAFVVKRDGKSPLRFTAFLWVNNVLNTWNVIGVFPFTGQPNDDGFLNSPQGQLLVKTQVDAQSYIDLYKILLNSQTQNWNAPRTIRFGLRLAL